MLKLKTVSYKFPLTLLCVSEAKIAIKNSALVEIKQPAADWISSFQK